ncbi:MAG: RnfABCDGE type electron transport complex subunit G [Firmicutes bacterium]|nr:RnfABCDGE type electron transport complex subunit G [Bacillota bacterium]
MKDILKPASILLLITIVAGGLLGYVNSVTKAPIEKQENDKIKASMEEVISGAATFADTEEVTDDPDIKSVTPALDKDGNVMGYAVSVDTKGFSAGLKLMFGVDTEGSVTGLSIVDCSNETPGLGANSGDPNYKTSKGVQWAQQFTGMSGEIKVDKDGGEVEAITGATITSRAVSNAAQASVNYIKEHKGGNK